MSNTGPTIASILEGKAKEVYVTPAAASIREAAKVMAEHNIGLLAVTGADGEFVGVLSERDIVRAMAEPGAAVASMTVDQLYTRDVVTCTPDDNPHDVMATMNAQRFRHVPVVVDAELQGVISQGDVIKYVLREVEYATLPIL